MMVREIDCWVRCLNIYARSFFIRSIFLSDWMNRSAWEFRITIELWIRSLGKYLAITQEQPYGIDRDYLVLVMLARIAAALNQKLEIKLLPNDAVKSEVV
jgi:hypothetical protein